MHINIAGCQVLQGQAITALFANKFWLEFTFLRCSWPECAHDFTLCEALVSPNVQQFTFFHVHEGLLYNSWILDNKMSHEILYMYLVYR